MSTTSEKANLARIRDNQRRSRARRKEYLQELEARLRQCELQGIEASAEIQLAARRVADENKKLRALLTQHGVGDNSVEAYLQSSSSTESIIPGQYGYTSSAVQVLEQLLQTRKPCCGDGNTGAPTNSAMLSTSSRNSSDSQSTVQSHWDPSQPQRRLLHPTPASAHQYMTPSSSGSRASNASFGHVSNQSIGHYQRLTPNSLPREPSPASSHANYNPQIFDFDMALPSTYNSHSTSQQSLLPQGMTEGSSIYEPITPSGLNVNSCGFATEMIATMTGGDPSDVRADLGCGPGMECEVDNHHVFDVMDRYTGSGVGT